MNAPLIPAEMRRRFTTADVERMVETGLIRPQERVELIEGELALMSPKHNRHEWVKVRLAEALTPFMKPNGLILAVETTLYLSERTFVEPDLLIYPRHILPEDVRGPDVTLLIEIGDSSLDFDLNAKAALYARHGIAHYWAVDAETLAAHVHEAPGEDGYAAVRVADKDEALAAPFVREALTLGALR